MKTTVRTFGAASVTECIVADGPALLPADARPGLLHLSFVRSGSVQYAEDDGHGGSEVRSISRGQGFLNLEDRRIEMTARGDCVIYTISVPLARGRNADDHWFYVMRGPVPLAPPMLAFATALFTTGDDLFDTTARHHAEHVLTAMIAAVAPHPFGGADAHVADPYTRAQAAIAARCADPALRTRDIALELSLSLRQLERAFRTQRTTLVAEIRRARVRSAVDLIESDVTGRLTMDQIARTVGLSGGSSLARAFRLEGLEPPRRRHRR
ncbi:MAG: hypothetical protein QM677_01040 [Microbacterium sp.]